MLRSGSRGTAVTELQQWLADNGFDPGPIDGIFGPKTLAAVKAFQTEAGISVDGIVGPQTTGAMDSWAPATTTEPTPTTTTQPAPTPTSGTVDAGGVAIKQGTENEEVASVGVGVDTGDPETKLTILTAKEMNWYFDKAAGKWYVGYGLPGSDKELLFEAAPDQMDALFGTGMRPVTYTTQSLNNLLSRDKYTFAGNIAEMEGEGTFENEFDKMISLALDEGRLPEWATGSKEIYDLLYIAQAENKSDEWLVDAISTTQAFKSRFGDAVDAFKKAGNLTTIEGVSAFLEYEAGVKQSLKAAGYSSDVVSPQLISGLVGGGYSLTTVNDTINKFKRMQDYAPAMDAFNSVLQANGLDPVNSLQGMYDFVSGQAPADMYTIYEASSFAEAAGAAGLTDLFTAEDAMQAALETEGNSSLHDITKGMQTAASTLLRFRNQVDMNQFGLDHEELIDISLGLVPSSGRTSAEINEAMQRAVSQAQKELGERGKPFTGFNQAGTPQQRSLSNLRTST